MVLYGGRECVMPWELEGDLGPLETEVDLPVEEVIDRIEVGEKVWRKNPMWNTKQKLLKKGPKWYDPYEVAERKDDGNGNYLLKSLSDKNKGQISKKSYPPNHLKRFIHRNPEIPGDSDSEYGSDNEDSVPASQDSAIGSQESVPENPSYVPSDAMTVLYPNPEEGDTLLDHTLVDDPVVHYQR